MRAVTLTKNTFANYVWVFNLLTWDTGRRGAPWRSLGQFDMSAVVSSNATLLRFPWRVCLRARGRRVDFKVWLPGREPAPSWTDPVHTRSTRCRTASTGRGCRAGTSGTCSRATT